MWLISSFTCRLFWWGSGSRHFSWCRSAVRYRLIIGCICIFCRYARYVLYKLMGTCVILGDCAEECEIIFKLLQNFNRFYRSPMSYDRSHGYHIKRLWPPYKNSQILIQRNNKLTPFIIPNSFNPDTLWKLLTLLILHKLLIFLIIFLDILFFCGWWFGEFPHQSQRIQIDYFNYRVIAATHNTVMDDVHTGCLGDHEIDAFLEFLLFIGSGYHTE